MTTYRGVHILRKELHKFSIAVTKRIVHSRAVSILWRKEFYRLGILGTKSNVHNGEVSPFSVEGIEKKRRVMSQKCKFVKLWDWLAYSERV